MFQPGDWVWIHLRKERFPQDRKSKLQQRGDGPFEIIEKIGDNAYKLDLQGKYGVSSTFNMADLSPYDGLSDDSWSNPLQEGEDDKDIMADPLRVPIGLITRSKSKKIRETFIGFVQRWWNNNSSPKEDPNEDLILNYICVIFDP